MSLEFEGELVIEIATEDDWEYIMPGFIEGTYMAMGPVEREELGPATIRERCAMQVEWIRSPDGFFNQAFIGRTADGAIVGHVWVARVLNQFTGRSEAMVLNLYVEEDFRGRGAAKRLMDVVEDWARDQVLELRRRAGEHATRNRAHHNDSHAKFARALDRRCVGAIQHVVGTGHTVEDARLDQLGEVLRFIVAGETDVADDPLISSLVEGLERAALLRQKL